MEQTIGNYEIKAKYENLIKSTSFAFTIPSSSTSKTSTFLKLDPLDNTVNVQGQDSKADVIISGQLLEGDGKTGIPHTKIKLVTDGFSLTNPTLTTDSIGKFAVKVTVGNNFVGEQLSIQTVYDGSSNFESSKSQTEYFAVKTSSQPQTTAPTEDSSPAGGVALLVIIMIVIIGTAIAIKKRKKKKIPVTIPPPSGRRTAGTATMTKSPYSKPRNPARAGKAPLLMRQQIRTSEKGSGKTIAKGKDEKGHYALFTMQKMSWLEEFLENEADGQQYCTKCGWEKVVTT